MAAPKEAVGHRIGEVYAAEMTRGGLSAAAGSTGHDDCGKRRSASGAGTARSVLNREAVCHGRNPGFTERYL